MKIGYKLLTPTAKAPVISYEGTDQTMGIDVFTSEDVVLWAPPKTINASLENVVDGLRDLYTEVYQAVQPGFFSGHNPSNQPVSVFIGDSYHPHPSILPYANIPTGISLDLPARVHVTWAGRSGLAFNNGRLPFEGKIDANYRGELKLKLWSMNPDDNGFFIPAGTKIAQLEIVHYQDTYELVEVVEVTTSSRGELGFGSSG